MEPSFGGADFLREIVTRLFESWKSDPHRGNMVDDLRDAIRAVELHEETFTKTRQALIALLTNIHVSEENAVSLVDSWLVKGDYLLLPFKGDFDYVVGNPPYVRQDLIPEALISEYRRRYNTIYDRADLYIPFIEKSLLLLSKGGRLGFICADRWMKNRYGERLRNLVSEHFHLSVYIDMYGTPAFLSEVAAYPAITVIVNEGTGPTRAAYRPEIEKSVLKKLAKDLLGNTPVTEDTGVRVLAKVTDGHEPWLLGSTDQVNIIRRLERDLPTIEEAGCRIGIGVATGADGIFIGNPDALDIEEDRKLPLVQTRDILTGTVKWRGQVVVNPFEDNGTLVDLDNYPKLARYLRAKKKDISKRHCAQKVPSNWYRTIDRIYAPIARKPKLLIPDIKGEAHVVYESGNLYPHHNLYYITSKHWNLRALQAVLLSEVTRLFLSTYSTPMRGGYLRFQAQYLRRLRIPLWKDVPVDLKKQLIAAGKSRDIRECNRAAFLLYRLTEDEQSAIGGNGE